MFQFPGFASPAYGFSRRYRRSGGLPHSEIHGSKPARGSPWLIATCCVLHRLSVPRHPPDALQTLDLIGAYSTSKSPPTNAPRAGESPQGPTTSPQPHPAKMHHMTQPTATPTLEATALSGHPRSQSSSHVKDPIPASADICVLSRGYLTAGSSKVTIRHCPLPLVEADGIEPTTSCLQSTRSPN